MSTAALEALRHPGVNLGSKHGEAHERAEGVVFGFWVYMMSDLIIFGLLFATYVTMIDATAGGPGPGELFHLGSAFAQTMLLLMSSFSIGMACLAMKYRSDTKRLFVWLAVTLLLGAGFLVLEMRDLIGMLAQGAGPARSGFLSAFFALVPLHGLHVAAGLLWLLVLALQIAMFGLVHQVKTRILRLALFWHLLDVVWVGIFSVVYLGGLA